MNARPAPLTDPRGQRFLPDTDRLAAMEFNGGHTYTAAWVPRAINALLEAADRWHITLHEPLSDGIGSIVAAASLPDGTPVVLKAAHTQSVAALEATGLATWTSAGSNVPELLAHDSILGVNLMTRLQTAPGTPTTVDVVRLAETLHACPPPARYVPAPDATFDRLIAVGRKHHAGTPQHEQQLTDCDTAATLFRKLAAKEPAVLSHGDYSQKNLMVTPAGLCAFDPLTVLAPPAFDLAKWVAWGGTIEQSSLDELVVDVLDASSTLDPGTFALWVWAMAVCGNAAGRPVAPGAFIAAHRCQAEAL